MVDPTKANWSKVDIGAAMETLDSLIEHSKSAIKLYEQMGMLFRVVNLFPDIKEGNKKFTVHPEGWHGFAGYIAVEGEAHRTLTRKQMMYITRGDKNAYDDAVRDRARQDNKRGAVTNPS